MQMDTGIHANTENDTGAVNRSGNTSQRSMWAGIEMLFLAAFSLTISFIPNTIVLHVLKTPLNPLLSTAFTVCGYLGFVLLLGFYVKRTGGDADKGRWGKSIGGLISSSVGVLLMYLITLVFALLYKEMLSRISVLLNFDGQAMVYLAGLTISALLLLIFLFSAVALTVAVLEYNIPLKGIGRAYGVIAKGMVRYLFKVIYYGVVSGLLLYAVNIVQNLNMLFLESFLQPGFFRNFIFYTIGALINGCFFMVLIVLSRRFLFPLKISIVEMGAKPFKSPVPFFALTLVLVCIVLSVVLVPLGKNAVDGILAEVALHQEKGDMALNLTLSQRAIYEYDLAYSKLLALKAYLQGLKYLKEELPVTLEQSNLNMTEAARISVKNPYVPYFKGQLLLQGGNPDGAIEAFKTAVLYKQGVVESYFGLLEAYKIKDQKDQLNEVLQILENTETYSDNLASIKNMSVDKIDKILDQIAGLEDTLGPKMIYKALEKLKVNDAGTTLNELLVLQKLYPKDPQINYQIARVANEFRNENVNYATVVTYASLFDQLSENGKSNEDVAGRKLFIAQMYQGAGDANSAVKIMEDAFAKFPENVEIRFQYAYLLNETNQPNEALAVLKDALVKTPKDLQALYLSSLAYLTLKDLPNSLKMMDAFVQAAGSEPKNNRILDKDLYNYCIVLYKTFPGVEADGEVALYEKNALLYNYLNAIKGWKNRDSEVSNRHMKEVLTLRQDLGYAYYIVGVNYFESTVRTGGADFSQAASYYQESLKLLPNHVEGYFALGHCYLKWGKNLEALRAFRKVVDLMPYEDHRVDPYGMSVHAVMQVNALSQFDMKEVN